MGDCQTRVLREFSRDVCSVEWFVLKCDMPRKAVLRALGRLMNNKMVRRANVLGDFPAYYCITDVGRAQLASGKPIKSGPKRPHTGPRKVVAGTLRTRLWTAFRMKQKATLPDLIEIARRRTDPDTGDCAGNAQIWMRRLVAAGVAVEMTVKARGFAPTSNGFKRFLLIRDLGPLAPSTGAKGLFDPNSGRRLPYLKGHRGAQS